MLTLALAACGEEDDASSGFDNVCRVEVDFDGYYQLSWDQDATSRFLELLVDTPGTNGRLYSSQCTQLDTSLPPACSVDVDSYCRTPDPDDGNRSEPCSLTQFYVVKGGHLVIEAEASVLEVGKCNTKR